MAKFLLAHEPLVRMTAFFGVLTAMALWEAAAPRRRREIPRLLRWSGNLGIVVLDTAIVRLLFPMAAVALAAVGEQRGWGLLHAAGVSYPAAVFISLLALDLTIYLQHAMFHAAPALWRLHRVHHADLEFDVTTGTRFHPAEIVLSMLIKFAAIVALGPPPVAVLLFEVVLNATAMFNHSNVRLPLWIDRWLRFLVVTPDMHRVHHSAMPAETHSNFGFNLPWWDRMFGTYRAQPRAGHEGMTIGVEDFRSQGDLRLDRMLTQPWRGRSAEK